MSFSVPANLMLNNSSSNSSSDGCFRHLRQQNHIVGLYLYYRCKNYTSFVDKFLEMRQKQEQINRAELPAVIACMSIFCLLILFGAVGNGLVVRLICCGRFVNSPRHVFVLNLALSDFVLCTVTQPINMLRLLQEYLSWEYGTPLCKLANGLTGLNLFVSTFSIMAIALDRFQAIVHPSQLVLTRAGLLACALGIWAAASLLASPLLLFARVVQNALELPRVMHVCSEILQPESTSLMLRQTKLAYSLATLIVQYLIPLLVLVAAYGRIHARLRQKIRYRRESGQSAYQLSRILLEERRHRRTNGILLAISLVFALSWLPLTVLNIFNDFQEWRIDLTNSTQAGSEAARIKREQVPLQLIQSVSLMLILLSSCANPLLYGFLNESFRTELFRLLRCTRLLATDEAEAAGSQAEAPPATASNEVRLRLRQLSRQQQQQLQPPTPSPTPPELTPLMPAEPLNGRRERAASAASKSVNFDTIDEWIDAEPA